MATGLSLREAAERVGVSNPAIKKARDAGRINRMADGTIDPDSLDKWSATRRAPRGGANRASERKKPLTNQSGGQQESERERVAKAALAAVLAPGGRFPDRASAELARDSYQAHLRQLQYEERAGKLLGVEKVNQAIADCCSKVRTALFAIPSERAPAIARLKTAVEVQEALRIAITEALEGLPARFDEIARK